MKPPYRADQVGSLLRPAELSNALAQDEQWRKLELIVETAGEVWGGA